LTALLLDNYKQSLEAAGATIVLASSLEQVCRLNFIKNYITTHNLEGTLDQQKEYCSKYFDTIDAMDDDLQSELQTVTARRDLLAFQQQAATLSSQLTQALALGANNGGGSRDNDEGKNFPDFLLFDGTKLSQIRSWIIKLRIKLAAQQCRYPTEQAQLRYASIFLDLRIKDSNILPKYLEIPFTELRQYAQGRYNILPTSIGGTSRAEDFLSTGLS
jgi:hypothetical protein